jgi:hypothetical protein
MPRFKRGATKQGVRPPGKKRKPLPFTLPDEPERERVRIPEGPARRPVPQSQSTSVMELTGPGEEHGIVFPIYTPLTTPKNPKLFAFAPPDMSGAALASVGGAP